MKYLAKVCQFHVHVRVRGHVHVRVRGYVHVHVRVLSVSLSVSMKVSVSISISVLFLFKYGAMNVYGRHGNYSVNFQGSYEVARKLKGPLIKRGWLKSANNLGTSPFKRDLSNDTTYSQTNLAGQSLNRSCYVYLKNENFMPVSKTLICLGDKMLIEKLKCKVFNFVI
jgi:hypothetical protein